MDAKSFHRNENLEGRCNANTTVAYLPEDLHALNLKNVKAGSYYHYVIKFLIFLSLASITIPIMLQSFASLEPESFFPFFMDLRFNVLWVVSAVACGVVSISMISRRNTVYLVDFCCFTPPDCFRIPFAAFLEHSILCGRLNRKSVEFQKKILERSGLSELTSFPPAMHYLPPKPSIQMARAEAETVIYSMLDDLFSKTGVNPRDITFLIMTCSLFNPTPSISSMIINKYKMRSNINAFNLGGMGCAAGTIAIQLVKDLLKVHPNSYGLVVSSENITLNWYLGNQREMLLPNCLFRVGGSAILLSNKRCDRKRSKYQLLHTVRTHKAADDSAYKCVYQEEDEDGIVGVKLNKDLMVVAGEAVKTNLGRLGPLVLPISEQLLYAAPMIARKFDPKIKPYIPNFKLAFEHFCIHAGGRALIDELEKRLHLGPEHVEASRMTLYRFGNVSSPSVWYELAYTEAKGRVRKGDRVWQVGLGSGFKCASAVWKALQDITPQPNGPWRGCICDYPVKVLDVRSI